MSPRKWIGIYIIYINTRLKVILKKSERKFLINCPCILLWKLDKNFIEQDTIIDFKSLMYDTRFLSQYLYLIQ